MRHAPRTARRALCVITVLVLGKVAFFFPTSELYWAWIGALGCLGACLIIVTRGLAFRSAKKLDERELQVSLWASQQGYGYAFAWFILTAVDGLINWATLTLQAVTVSPDELVTWFFVILLVPTVSIAWTEPDLPADGSFERVEM